jgi:hypothetical protein
LVEAYKKMVKVSSSRRILGELIKNKVGGNF